MFAYSHIPKTAGTTLNEILRKNFGANLLSIIPRSQGDYTYSDLKKDIKIYKNAQCISGHGLKAYIDYNNYDSSFKWFTFVRDPIKRYVSQYIHQQTSDEEKHKLKIEDWAKKFNRSNWMVKWIAGEENLEKAISIINNKFIFVGVVEEFDISLKQMGAIFNIEMDLTYDKPKMVTRDNSLKKSLLVDRFEELKPLFEKENSLDIALYKYIKDEVFERQSEFHAKNSKLTESDNLQSRSKNNLYKFSLKRDFIYKPYVYLTK